MGTAIGGLGVALQLFLMVVAIFYLFVPFILIGIKNRLDTTNALLQRLAAEVEPNIPPEPTHPDRQFDPDTGERIR